MTSFNLQGPIGPVVNINGQSCLYFGGTSYFCLHNRQELIRAANVATQADGIGSATSRLGVGSTTTLQKLESTAAKFFGRDDAVYLASGFLTAIAVSQRLMDSTDLIVADEATHFSSVIAARATGKRLLTFSHLDPDNLAAVIAENINPGESPLIVTDGVFPSRGEIAPVPAYLRIADGYDGRIWIDDAHGIGVLGDSGRGTCDHFELSSTRVFYGGSLAKAFGGFGGIIPGDSEFVSELKTDAVAVTASCPSAADIAASTKGIEILAANPEMRERLRNNTLYLKDALRSSGISVDNTNVPIIAWQLDKIDEMISLRDALLRKGIYVQFIENYGAVDSDAYLRICIFSEHTMEQLDQLTCELKSLS